MLSSTQGDVPAHRKGSEILLSVCRSSACEDDDGGGSGGDGASGGDGGASSCNGSNGDGDNTCRSRIEVKRWRPVCLVDAILDSKWSLNTLCSVSACGDVVLCAYDTHTNDYNTDNGNLKRAVYKHRSVSFVNIFNF